MRSWRVWLKLSLLVIAITGDTAFSQVYHPARTVTIVIHSTNTPPTLPPLEICALPGNRRVALTTMWDDGPASTFPGGGDLRMARALATNGWKATFGWALTSEAIGDTPAIRATGMEVCSHTATHPMLLIRTKNTVFWELLTSKIYLSVLTQQPVVSYDDAFQAHDEIINREIQQAGYMVGRFGFGSFSIFDISRRHLLPTTWLAVEGTNNCRQALNSLYASGTEGLVQSYSGHAYPPEFNEDFWSQFMAFVGDYAHRADTWYATWAEVGSQMLLRHAAQLGPPQLGDTAVHYLLTIAPLPRDVRALPLTLRMTGAPEQLREISFVSVNWQWTPTRIENGALLFDVNPFGEDLYARVVSADLANSANPTVQQTLHSLPVVSDPDLEAGWTLTQTNEVYELTISVTNRGAAVLEALAFEVFSSTAWNTVTQGVVPPALSPASGFQTRCTLSPAPGENVGGWAAFAGRLDYASRGTPRTHYLFHDALLPISQALRPRFVGPNCQVAGPIVGGTSNLASILAEAEGKWTSLAYDPINRPSVINLTPVYYTTNLLVPGFRVLRSHLFSDSTRQGVLKVLQQYRLTGLRFWINDRELVLGESGYAFTLNPGVNRFIAVCDATSDIEPFYRWPIIVVAVEPAFLAADGQTPLAGITFTASPDLLLRLEQKPATGSFLLNWTTIPGRTYRVEFTASLTEPQWTAFGPDRSAEADTLEISFAQSGLTQGFFRVIRID